MLSKLLIYLELAKAFINNQKYRYYPYKEIIKRWRKNGNIKYKIMNIKEAGKHKKTDTLFVVGSGPGILDISKEQWEYIGKHDSFGINYSFLLEFIPDYISIEDDRTYEGKIFFRKYMQERFYSRREKYKNTIVFISERHYFRYIHPRIIPELFPINSKVCFYKYPKIIMLNKDRPFIDSDFEESLVYRGSLAVILELVKQMCYKNIVIMGVDLNTSKHFYDNYEEMQGYVKRYMNTVGGDGKKYETMIPKNDKYRTMEEYLYAVNEYLKNKGINLYITKKESMLYPKINVYEWNT